MFREPSLSKALELVEKLKPIAVKHGITVGHIALALVLNNPVITSAIVGARNKIQSLENIKAADFVLAKEENTIIKNLILEIGL